jgi:putative transposase
MYLSEIHRIYKEDTYFNLLDNFSFNAKNLYNNGLYHIRQYYIYCKNLKEGKPTTNLNVPQELIDYMVGKGSYIDYYKLDYLSKKLDNSLTEDYKSLPISSAAQWVLKQLNQNWSSFFKSLKDFVKNPSKGV